MCLDELVYFASLIDADSSSLRRKTRNIVLRSCRPQVEGTIDKDQGYVI
jgi:hypothetical protein